MTYKEFSKIIKIKRIKYGYLQRDIAKKLYISISKYCKIENGSTEPSFQELLTICKLLKISLDNIIKFDELNKYYNID
ncbi:MAG: helix-turn-helix transcriptional regulator [Acholeplasmatales bacterium]|nr:helix-turn-helix transcriptional regulator [Acholeplasmatales bacterium]